MIWQDYKARCERPDHFSRFALELTLGADVADEIGSQLVDAMNGAPVEKPLDHRGGAETDYFSVDLDARWVPSLVQALDRHALKADERGKRHLRHLAVVWQEYAAYKKLVDEEG